MKIGIKTLMALAMGLMIAGSSVGFAEDVKAKSSPLKNKATSTKAVEDPDSRGDHCIWGDEMGHMGGNGRDDLQDRPEEEGGKEFN